MTITAVDDLGPEETNFGTKDRIRVTFTAQDQNDKAGAPVRVSPKYTKSLHKKSTFVKSLLVPLGFTVVNNEFDTDELIGTKCQVVIQHKESEGQTYANVTAVLRNRPTKSAAPAAESF